ncbi:Ribonuclease D (RNase D) [Magnetospirillum gryphiswaldense MSR-1 v2]|uniref:Ribonuclease D n=1 Tax=Magnetospirillum gryphiswaldense (strain DSM 6361 / JCM 21280 / NBRC 15271 / MSR-1) TaxID=431944 RepID=V6EWF9_MAGGM|nr:ribonuclease D [Magnetospirillum gryphiswaldense]CDK97615.1 Ribonuclease D (RNase D) [Magnetospirillum gryphiswaldense MSR-1 v2]
MPMIADTAELAAFCQRLSSAPYITVDTEFMREKTYYPQLCLVQLAGPDEARAVDPLAPGMDLAPLFELMANPNVLKVFHAARQDVEIFLHLSGAVPAPLFDTQVAAMVCGFGDSVGYETLASQLAKARIDKSQRFTDWALRPLTEKQIQYALADVTHLRVAYEKLVRKLERNGRLDWLVDEMAELASPDTYRTDPENAWKRLKPRSSSPKFLAVLKELAAWREREAQERDIPRQRMLRDETLMEIAAHHPANVDELARTRGMGKGMVEGRMGTALLEAVKRGLALPEDQIPKPPERVELPRGLGPVVDLLKVLLKMKCDAHGVASKLVANSADIEAIAADDHAEIPALHGWRRDLFGEDALALKHGRLALGFCTDGRKLRLVPMDPVEPQCAPALVEVD